MSDIAAQARRAMDMLLGEAALEAGQVVVVGCSTSEVAGKPLGTAGSLDIANALLDGLLPPIEGAGLYLAVQCCEHLNRALVVDKRCLERYSLDEVCVVPYEHAGGALAAAYHARLGKPVLAERIQAHAGMDIGLVLVGMHLRPVAVPLRTGGLTIGDARVVIAKTRPKLIGGERAKYA